MYCRKKFLASPCIALCALLQVHAAEPSTPPNPTQTGPEEIITNSIGIKLRRIEPGTFRMGSENGDHDEKPTREVTITKPFYIGVCEVTQEQYAQVMGSDQSRFPDPNRPVENVTWEDAKAFCKKLSEKENATYRLPTEAEWEYACRAGTRTVFHWGDSFNTGFFWCGYNSSYKSHQVGKAKPNSWGLYDMSGNVWEWCEDWYAEGAYSSSGANDPKGPQIGTRRVVRGGAWWGTPEDCRSANRFSYPPDGRRDTIGFRVCRVGP